MVFQVKPPDPDTTPESVVENGLLIVKVLAPVLLKVWRV